MAAVRLAARAQSFIRALQEDTKASQSYSAHQATLVEALNLDKNEGAPSTSLPLPGNGLQPYQAYSQLLRHWIPLLFEELDSCAEFLMLKDEGSAASASNESNGRDGLRASASCSEQHICVSLTRFKTDMQYKTLNSHPIQLLNLPSRCPSES